MESDDLCNASTEKICTWKAHQTHKNLIEKLKYQQVFLKVAPPTVYKGEVQASVFNKWVREMQEWSEMGLLDTYQSLQACGKFSSDRAYRYYEQEVCNRGRWPELEDHFIGLCEYIFPATFCGAQRDKFDLCDQCTLSVRDYQDLADTIGGLVDNNIVRTFFRRVNPSLRAALASDGYRVDSTTLEELEVKSLAIEEGTEITREAC